jgi:RNA polymerase sigma-70 factor, ECF subfamily
MDETELVKRAIAGDHDAFANLVRLHQGRLRGMVALTIFTTDDVHDVVQESFIDAWNGLPGFEAGCEFGPWLRTICRHRVQRFLRQRLPHRRQALALVDEALLTSPPKDEGEGNDRRLSALRTCLAELASGHRQLVTQRFRDGIAVQDIASQLGRSPNAVSMLLLRLKSSLMRCVGIRMAESVA